MDAACVVGGVLLFLAVVSVFDLFSDPHYHKSKVNFWVWCARELDEELHGERREGI